MPFVTVDADVVVPSRIFDKEEYAARTIRPKIHRRLDEFLKTEPSPELKTRKAVKAPANMESDPDLLYSRLNVPTDVKPVEGFRGSPTGARKQLTEFVRNGLKGYDRNRNRPERRFATSRLSPYLHFGQLSPAEAALAVRDSGALDEDKDAFLEQLIVRRELAVNFVLHNPHYDSVRGFHEWAKGTLDEHRNDERPYCYDLETLESGATHDELWNAAQLEMVHTGFMFGYMRMYWAKKILHWTSEPDTALKWTIYLNDKYSLDGRDPNGYAGIAWAIGGKHDRGWPEREIFGKIRYMSHRSTSRKFDSDSYVRQVQKLL
ncbi:MAG: hypothetical protein U5N86_07630 [Planctomycetota bacterium]|nr:hypothetical protein [Planctomycetota bacterium]